MTLTGASSSRVFSKILEMSCGSLTFSVHSFPLACCADDVHLAHSHLSGGCSKSKYTLDCAVHLYRPPVQVKILRNEVFKREGSKEDGKTEREEEIEGERETFHQKSLVYFIQSKITCK